MCENALETLTNNFEAQLLGKNLVCLNNHSSCLLQGQIRQEIGGVQQQYLCPGSDTEAETDMQEIAGMQ